MRDDSSDRIFTDRALAHLSAEFSGADYEAALLAAYDAWNARRADGHWAALRASLRQISESVWPGAPLWAPASAITFALLLGAGLGVALPSVVPEDQPVFSLEQPAGFNLSSAGTAQEDP
ncbi:MAG TPA: hypothetical protein VKB67_05715 [Rhizomicrobium sp.]|nr:hypothetical protein [Rhizomicrobium sp.]